jgi:hypothetical protein
MVSNLASVCLYVFVGIISRTMAYKNLFFNKFIPFHEKAAGKPLGQFDNGLQAVMIALMRVSGLGFLAVALLLMLFPVANYYAQNTFIKYAVPAIALMYCSGLFLFNYQLYSKTGTETPWKFSLYAVGIILLGFVLSLT